MRATLTELEGAVLAVLRQQGPFTAYQARRVFLDSPSAWWSGSAGAVYPLLARLERGGLVRGAARRGDARGGRTLSLTAAGRRRLAAWVGPPLPDWVTDVPMDALRTRLGLLFTLSPARRARLLVEAERGMRAQLDRIADDLARARREGDEAGVLFGEGAGATQRARLAWVRQLRRRLDAARGKSAREGRGSGRATRARSALRRTPPG